jgi:hypothetical protein
MGVPTKSASRAASPSADVRLTSSGYASNNRLCRATMKFPTASRPEIRSPVSIVVHATSSAKELAKSAPASKASRYWRGVFGVFDGHVVPLRSVVAGACHLRGPRCRSGSDTRRSTERAAPPPLRLSTAREHRQTGVCGTTRAGGMPLPTAGSARSGQAKTARGRDGPVCSLRLRRRHHGNPDLSPNFVCRLSAIP